jgi:hypothetical protein
LRNEPELRNHCRGKGGKREEQKNTHNSFVLRILTSNRYALKILQPIFAEAAPVKAFQRGWGEGVHDTTRFSQNETTKKPAMNLSLKIFLRHISTSTKNKSRPFGAAPIPGSIRGSVNRSREFAC